MNTIDEIKARIDIVDLVSETVQLRHAGKNYTGFCPFHPNSRTPAFVVWPDSGTWRCFGQCNEGGDIFRFMMKREGWDFPETLRRLAERAGVQIQPLTPEREAEVEEHENLRALLEEAVTFYRHQLIHTQAGKPAFEYLRKRGLTDQTIEIFGLGYAPAGWENALSHFKGKGYTEADLKAVGLVTERDSGGVYDRFRNRVIIPIRDGNGGMAGFGARILDPNDVPKFLNSPQTVLFDKGRLLYGLDQARKPIRAKDQVVIVEGYLDVIALHQAGFTNAVSPMGTALTEDQLHLLKRYTRRVVLALDADAAGEKATLRGLEVARTAMDHTAELTFDARGLLRHEARLQADVRITTLPPGMDPDEVALRDPDEWAAIVENAKPVVAHVMDTLAAGQNLDDPKVKSSIAARVIPLIEDVANSIERDAYRQRLARLLKVDERILMDAQPGPSRMPRRPNRSREALRPAGQYDGAPQERVIAASPGYMLEKICLGGLVRKPETIHVIDRRLQEAGLSRLDITDFRHTNHQVILRKIQESVEQTEAEPGEYVFNHLDEMLREQAAAWRSEPLPQDSSPEELVDDLFQQVLRLRYTNSVETMNQIRFLEEELHDSGDFLARSYLEMKNEYLKVRDRIDQARAKREHKPKKVVH